MGSSSRVTVVLERERNILRVSFFGAVGFAEVDREIPALVATLAELQPGFTLITDLSDVTQMDASCVPAIEKTMDLLRERGVKRIVRIIPDHSKDIGINILSLFHYPPGFRAVTVTTREEAERAVA